ncbi:hypothetical protein CCR75_002003 [Bremia lactucae]|uniref:Uncharacterized protein n=1 Tax=Bremia lactucae TaxID=4779 RepID=A0A976FR98_BRELC|nr:hypothetical protein CCR75_002003 [Bremia lactucae]
MFPLGKEYKLDDSEIITATPDAFPLKTTASLPEQAPLSVVWDEMLFRLKSWTLKAMEFVDFFKHIKSSVTDPLGPIRRENRNQLLKDKYFVAMGSARYMFKLSGRDAAIELEKTINAVDDFRGYVNHTHLIPREGPVTRLFSRYQTDFSAPDCLLSNHVGKILARLLGPDFVKRKLDHSYIPIVNRFEKARNFVRGMNYIKLKHLEKLENQSGSQTVLPYKF